MELTDLFLKTLSMSFTATYCILLICIVRLFLGRAPKIFSYLLWSVVAVRLLCPVTFESSFSLMGERLLAFTSRIESGSSAKVRMPEPSPAPFSLSQTQPLPDLPPVNPDSKTAHMADPLPSSGNPAAEYHGADNVPPVYDMADVTTDTGFSGKSHIVTDTAEGHLTLQRVAGAASGFWLAGMLGLFGYYVFSCLHLRRSLSEKGAVGK